MDKKTRKTFLLPGELAELIRVSPATLRQWRYSDAGPPYYRMGRKIVYSSEDIAKWIDLRQGDQG